MLLVVFLILVAVPAIEIALFVEVGGLIGVWPTILLTFTTAIAGTIMLRVQGLSTLRRAEQSLARDEPPVRELIDGMCLLLAGLMLLIPGFATDVIGLLLFIPPLRRQFGLWLWGWFKSRPGVKVRSRYGRGFEARDGVIDGEFEEVQDDAIELPPPPPPKSSKWGRR
ncbi:MAG: FxsA family protein [Alphaproteobacteria bacterium]|nr:FxsA family protein [Alphaproteobacteria bacterium]